jgi:hypothetical protein
VALGVAIVLDLASLLFLFQTYDEIRKREKGGKEETHLLGLFIKSTSDLVKFSCSGIWVFLKVFSHEQVPGDL